MEAGQSNGIETPEYANIVPVKSDTIRDERRPIDYIPPFGKSSPRKQEASRQLCELKDIEIDQWRAATSGVISSCLLSVNIN